MHTNELPLPVADALALPVSSPTMRAPLLLDAAELVARAADGALPEQAVGQLVALLADWRLGGSRGATLRLLVAARCDERLLASPEFLEGLGAGRLKSSRVLAHAFARSRGSPAAALRRIDALVGAGAVNVFSSSALAALHRGMAAWGAAPAPKAALLGALVASLDTFAEAGTLLAALLEHADSELLGGPAAAEELLRAVLREPAVRDLAGEPADLAAHLPDFEAAVAEALAAGASDDDGDDADEAGNLAGFVDDEIRYDTDAREDEGRGSDGEGGGAAGARRRGGGGGGSSSEDDGDGDGGDGDDDDDDDSGGSGGSGSGSGGSDDDADDGGSDDGAGGGGNDDGADDDAGGSDGSSAGANEAPRAAPCERKRQRPRVERSASPSASPPRSAAPLSGRLRKRARLARASSPPSPPVASGSGAAAAASGRRGDPPRLAAGERAPPAAAGGSGGSGGGGGGGGQKPAAAVAGRHGGHRA